MLKAFAHILSGVSAHWRQALKPALPWLLAVALLNAWDLKSQLSTTAEQTAHWMDFVSALFSLIAGSSIAVTWHQFILRDVPMASAPIFRLDQTVWRYVGRILLIVAICFLPLLALIIASQYAPLILAPIIIGLLIQLMVFGYRMSLTLPAAAVNNPSFGIREALEITSGNNLRILALIALIALMILGGLLVMLIVVRLSMFIHPNAAQFAAFLVGIPVLVFNSLLTSNLLTSIYGFFVEKREF